MCVCVFVCVCVCVFVQRCVDAPVRHPGENLRKQHVTRNSARDMQANKHAVHSSQHGGNNAKGCVLRVVVTTLNRAHLLDEAYCP